MLGVCGAGLRLGTAGGCSALGVIAGVASLEAVGGRGGRVGACGGAAATLGYMIAKVDLTSVSDCWHWFRKCAWFTGGAISVGLLGEYLMQYYGLYTKHGNHAIGIDDRS